MLDAKPTAMEIAEYGDPSLNDPEAALTDGGAVYDSTDDADPNDEVEEDREDGGSVE